MCFSSLFACATSVSAGSLSQCRRITVDTQYHLLVRSSKSAHKLGETMDAQRHGWNSFFLLDCSKYLS